MIEEVRRRAYLTAMQVASWLPRVELPFAAPSRAELLQEYPGYSQLKAMKTGRVFQASTSSQPYFEQTSFHPERLLREFIILSHPETTRSLGALRYYLRL